MAAFGKSIIYPESNFARCLSFVRLQVENWHSQRAPLLLGPDQGRLPRSCLPHSHLSDSSEDLLNLPRANTVLPHRTAPTHSSIHVRVEPETTERRARAVSWLRPEPPHHRSLLPAFIDKDGNGCTSEYTAADSYTSTNHPSTQSKLSICQGCK